MRWAESGWCEREKERQIYTNRRERARDKRPPCVNSTFNKFKALITKLLSDIRNLNKVLHKSAPLTIVRYGMTVARPTIKIISVAYEFAGLFSIYSSLFIIWFARKLRANALFFFSFSFYNDFRVKLWPRVLLNGPAIQLLCCIRYLVTSQNNFLYVWMRRNGKMIMIKRHNNYYSINCRFSIERWRGDRRQASGDGWPNDERWMKKKIAIEQQITISTMSNCH